MWPRCFRGVCVWRSFLVAAAAWLLLCLPAATASTISFNVTMAQICSDSGGSKCSYRWSDTSVWIGGVLPGPADDAIIDLPLSILNKPFRIDMADIAPISVNSLTAIGHNVLLVLQVNLTVAQQIQLTEASLTRRSTSSYPPPISVRADSLKLHEAFFESANISLSLRQLHSNRSTITVRSGDWIVSDQVVLEKSTQFWLQTAVSKIGSIQATSSVVNLFSTTTIGEISLFRGTSFTISSGEHAISRIYANTSTLQTEMSPKLLGVQVIRAEYCWLQLNVRIETAVGAEATFINCDGYLTPRFLSTSDKISIVGGKINLLTGSSVAGVVEASQNATIIVSQETNHSLLVLTNSTLEFTAFPSVFNGSLIFGDSSGRISTYRASSFLTRVNAISVEKSFIVNSTTFLFSPEGRFEQSRVRVTAGHISGNFSLTPLILNPVPEYSCSLIVSYTSNSVNIQLVSQRWPSLGWWAFPIILLVTGVVAGAMIFVACRCARSKGLLQNQAMPDYSPLSSDS